MTPPVTFPSPDAHVSEGVGRSLPVGRLPRGPPPPFGVGADWRGMDVLQLFQTALVRLRNQLRRWHGTQRFPRTSSLVPEPRVYSRGLSACNNWKTRRSAVAPNVWLLNWRRAEVKPTCQRLHMESPKAFLGGFGWRYFVRLSTCNNSSNFFSNESVEDNTVAMVMRPGSRHLGPWDPNS